MKRPISVAVLGLLAVAFPLLAQESGPSANGEFQAAGKTVQFNARTHNNGQTSGQMSFGTADDLGDQDVDGGGDSNPGGAQNLGMTVNFDCLKIKGNRAVMSGVISASSVGQYIGLRTLLIVEDGGEGSKKTGDSFAWGLYRSGSLTWVASDAELEFDPGVGLSWFATDFDRDIDTPIQINPSAPQSVNCASFPVDGYDLQQLPHGSGNIQVKP
jgi:hypothetical protein